MNTADRGGSVLFDAKSWGSPSGGPELEKTVQTLVRRLANP